MAIPNEALTRGSAVLAFVALAPLYFAAKNARSYKECALLFALDALSCHLLSSYWLANFKDFAALTLGASAVGTACIEAMAGCLFFFPLAKSGRPQSLKGDSSIYIRPGLSFPFEPYRILHFAAVRVVYEWAKSTGFLAYPWGVLSMAAFDNKLLLQTADIFGSYGLSFMMAFCAALAGEAAGFLGNIRAKKDKFSLLCNAKCLFLMLSLAICYGSFRLLQFTPPQKTLNAVLVQQNMDPWASSDDTQSMESSIRLSEAGINAFRSQDEPVDLVVWSEAVLRYAFPHSMRRYDYYPQEESLFAFIQRMETPFIIGGPYSFDPSRHKHANAALVFDGKGDFKGWYGKNHLVPFAEVIPGVEYPWVRKTMERVVGFSNGWTAPGTYTLFDFKGRPSSQRAGAVKIVPMDDSLAEQKSVPVRVAVPICFEDAFPDVCGPFHQAGAEVFMNITDDSWSKTVSAEWQHFAVAIFRAVEYRTTLVRSTNAGVTAVVDNKGRVLQSLPLFEEGSLSAKIPIFKHVDTVYSKYGNWFAHFMLALIALAAVLKALEFRAPPLRDCVMAELEKIEFLFAFF